MRGYRSEETSLTAGNFFSEVALLQRGERSAREYRRGLRRCANFDEFVTEGFGRGSNCNETKWCDSLKEARTRRVSSVLDPPGGFSSRFLSFRFRSAPGKERYCNPPSLLPRLLQNMPSSTSRSESYMPTLLETPSFFIGRGAVD